MHDSVAFFFSESTHLMVFQRWLQDTFPRLFSPFSVFHLIIFLCPRSFFSPSPFSTDSLHALVLLLCRDSPESPASCVYAKAGGSEEADTNAFFVVVVVCVFVRLFASLPNIVSPHLIRKEHLVGF